MNSEPGGDLSGQPVRVPTPQAGDSLGGAGGRRTLALSITSTLAGSLIGLGLVWLVGRPLGLSFDSAMSAFVGVAAGATVLFLGQPVFRRMGRVVDRIAERDARRGAARVGLDRSISRDGEDA